jgi:hypothetical protein
MNAIECTAPELQPRASSMKGKKKGKAAPIPVAEAFTMKDKANAGLRFSNVV